MSQEDLHRVQRPSSAVPVRARASIYAYLEKVYARKRIVTVVDVSRVLRRRGFIS